VKILIVEDVRSDHGKDRGPLTHQFDTNGGAANHCQQVGYNSTGPYPPQQSPPVPTPPGVLFCTMAVDFNLLMPGPWNSSLAIPQTVRQYGNAVTTFHMVNLGSGQWDSEYFTIRKRPDPWFP
jgi:hypothetical protein